MNRGMNSAIEGSKSDYLDFYSGPLFRDFVEAQGGISSVSNDIFLTLSSDGVQPFKSDDYSFWPFLCMLLNLPPHLRFQMKRLLLILIIPGPNEPKDLISFLDPFISEMKNLGVNGRLGRLWNGTVVRVRVHLLFLCGDLPAIKKLTHLKGVIGLVPCRFCHIKGVFVGHSYFPPVVNNTQDSRGRGKRRDAMSVLWDVDNLP